MTIKITRMRNTMDLAEEGAHEPALENCSFSDDRRWKKSTYYTRKNSTITAYNKNYNSHDNNTTTTTMKMEAEMGYQKGKLRSLFWTI